MIGRGFLIGASALTNFKFDQSRPYAGCRICGELYQSDENRLGSSNGIQEWRTSHNKLHNEREHINFIRSNRSFTPEAAQRLASFGIIDFGGLLTEPELTHAYATAPATPLNDVEGS